MRKWQLVIILSMVALAVGGYLYLTQKSPPKVTPIDPPRAAQGPKNDGDAEASEAIEPLRVNEVGAPNAAPTIDDGPMPPVALEPGQQQPPRPDMEPGTKLRMPYADEEEGLGLIRNMPEITDRELPRPNIFDQSIEPMPR